MPQETKKGINWNMILQIVLAIIIVLILYVVTLIILDVDSIVVKTSYEVLPRETTIIADGFAAASFFTTKTYNTVNPYTNNFLKISRSLNSQGGSQFTYQFWIKIEDATDSYFRDLILILKGDNRKYITGFYNQNNELQEKREAEHVIACPMIKFVDSYRRLRVQFNTRKSPFTTIDINMNPSETLMSRRNVTSLLALSKWFMFTFVFEDNFSLVNGHENGISFRFYIDDFRYQTNTPAEVSLRLNNLQQNDGDLFMMLNSNGNNANFMKMGNIKYYNFALTDEEVKSVFNDGPPTKDITYESNAAKKPVFLSAYNKIDVYNY